MLEAFEGNIVPLSEGDEFDFNLSVNEAYGPYVQEHVIELDKQVFTIDGRFDKENIYPGNVIPLTNADGNRFDGIIVEVKEKTVVVDLNHFLAGRDLHFCGKVIQSRPATDAEIQGYINMFSGEGCGCGCHDCGDGGCGEGGCGEGGCGGHHHEHGDGCCGGHEHKHGDGCCGGCHCH